MAGSCVDRIKRETMTRYDEFGHPIRLVEKMSVRERDRLRTIRYGENLAARIMSNQSVVDRGQF